MLYKIFILIVATLMIAGLTTKVFAQVKLSSTTAGAELVKALTIVNTTPMHFGVIGISAGSAGTVILNTAGIRTPDAPTTTIINAGSQMNVSLFNLTGESGDTYCINLPKIIKVSTDTGDGILTMDIGTLMVKVDNANEEAAPFSGTHTLKSSESTILLGGTLNISAEQALGQYTGTYNITVDYN